MVQSRENSHEVVRITFSQAGEKITVWDRGRPDPEDEAQSEFIVALLLAEILAKAEIGSPLLVAASVITDLCDRGIPHITDPNEEDSAWGPHHAEVVEAEAALHTAAFDLTAAWVKAHGYRNRQIIRRHEEYLQRARNAESQV